MKRILIGLIIGLLLLEAGRRLYRPADEAAAAGSAAYRAGDFTAAEAKFHEAEREAPNPSAAAHNRAAALYQLRRFDDADRNYQRSADDEARHAARAAYDRGNCAFSEACKDEGTADPDLLEKAAQQYETCLAHEGTTADAGRLFDDARHNLELSRLILSEFKEANKPNPSGEPSEPDNPAVAKNDPFAPSNAAHPPDGEGQPPSAEGAKGDPKGQEQKPAETVAKQDPNEQQTRECKQCKRGGCPKCKKKPGKGPGPQESAKKGDGPKPNPGDADNGKSPGKGKGQTEAKHSDPGAGKKGKPGEGGKPNPGEKNGVGDAKEPGTGPADENARPKKSAAEGKMVGPDGVTYERQNKPSRGGAAGGGDDPSDAQKQPEPGGKGGSPHGAPGDATEPRDPKDQPPAATVDKLFRPGTPRPNDRNDPGGGGMTSGQGRVGSGQFGAQTDETDGSGDPVERAAARRLRQAIQRIQGARQARPAPPGPGPGEAPASDRRRDW